MGKPKIKKEEFIAMCMKKADEIARKDYGLKPTDQLKPIHWTFRNGAMSMATEILKSQYEVMEESNEG